MSFHIQTKDRKPELFHHPIVLVLDNLRSAYNVGNIFRLAEVCRIKQIITCGYTATPPHSKLKKTARGCDELVSYRHINTSMEAANVLKEEGFQTIAIETIKNASYIWDITFQFPTAFILGNEALGISQHTIEYCDIFARLPVFGYKNSLNVSNCAAVVLYTAIQQLNLKQ